MGLIFNLVRAAHSGAELAAINAMRRYVRTLNVARRIVQTDLAIHLFSSLAMAGFLMLHVAVFRGLSWAESWVQAVILGALGLVYLAVGLTAALVLGSSRRWARGTGVSEMVEDIELPSEKNRGKDDAGSRG